MELFVEPKIKITFLLMYSAPCAPTIFKVSVSMALMRPIRSCKGIPVQLLSYWAPSHVICTWHVYMLQVGHCAWYMSQVKHFTYYMFHVNSHTVCILLTRGGFKFMQAERLQELVDLLRLVEAGAQYKLIPAQA